nr:MAG TPA: hypothetical protein [Caudoviricetes sp.]
MRRGIFYLRLVALKIIKQTNFAIWRNWLFQKNTLEFI